jgi:hypothetical protein
MSRCIALAIAALCASACLLLSPALVAAQPEPGAFPATGLKEPSPEEIQLTNELFPSTTSVNPNSLSLSRVNIERVKKGQSQISPLRVKNLAVFGYEAKTKRHKRGRCCCLALLVGGPGADPWRYSVAYGR